MVSLFERFNFDLRELKIDSEDTRDEIIQMIISSIRTEVLESTEKNILNERLEEAKKIGDWLTRNAVIDYVVAAQPIAEAELLIKKYILPHIGVLLRKRKEMVFIEEDDYGSRIKSDYAWNNEIDYFIENVIDQNDFKRLSSEALHGQIFDFIEKTFNEKNSDSIYSDTTKISQPCDAIQFEKTCAEMIKEQGWEVRLTKKTGDQGADIICTKDAISVVCQVKMFATKVGNKAVQEVLGAKEYYQSDFAVVIAKEGFTNSAIKLASCSNVLLLKFPHLEKFTIKVFSNL